jgi:hypothetical protein
MTNEERDRRLSAIEMDAVDIRIAYRCLGDAFSRFVGSVRSYRPDACEAFFERWREQRARADAEAERIEEEIFEANVGITNEGPDRWGPL